MKANGSANGSLHRNGDYRQLPVNPLPVNADGDNGAQVLLESESSTEDENMDDNRRLIWDCDAKKLWHFREANYEIIRNETSSTVLSLLYRDKF